MNNKYKKITEEILDLAGVKINGSNPWDIRINNDKFYKPLVCYFYRYLTSLDINDDKTYPNK